MVFHKLDVLQRRDLFSTIHLLQLEYMCRVNRIVRLTNLVIILSGLYLLLMY